MFDIIRSYRVSDLIFHSEPHSGLQAILAIHNTRFGPALGGCRFISYSNTESAVLDAVRLARGMSYKAVMAGVEQGGGMSVILKPHQPFDKTALFQAFGDFIASLNGRYITAIDSGTTAAEMDIIRQRTHHVTSTSSEDNPSDYTAQGVLAGIQAAVSHQLGRQDLKDIRVAIQGLGNVGMRLAEMLYQQGAKLWVTDLDSNKLEQAKQRFNAQTVAPDHIYTVECDVFSPCGLGGILNPEHIAALNCQVIAGSANNQLADDEAGIALFSKGILYAPDYVINAGGLIYASMHHHGKTVAAIADKTQHISQTLNRLFYQAQSEQQPTSVIADRMAEARLYGI